MSNLNRGINANVFIEDISVMSREDWLIARKKGIGGSDAGSILGLNKYSSPLDTYYEKIGAIDDTPVSDFSRVAMSIGNYLEPLLREEFIIRYPSFSVTDDKTMYQHRDYPFMLANVDGIITRPDNKKGILECKTFSMMTADDWISTNYLSEEDGKCPVHYEMQARHYMAVLDLDFAVVYGLDLTTKQFYRVIIERDLELEEKLILAEREFWDCVERKEAPTLNTVLANINNSLQQNIFLKYYKAVGSEYYVKDNYEVDLFNGMNEHIDKQSHYSDLSKQAKEKKEAIARELFLIAKDKTGKAPEFVRLEMDNVKQYVSLKTKPSVQFDIEAFIEDYNNRFENKLTKEIEESTLAEICKDKMPDDFGKYLTITGEKSRMYFQKRKE